MCFTVEDHAALNYNHLNTLIGSINNGAGSRSVYGYDAAGNRTSEYTERNFAVVQNATVSYDALGRTSRWDELGNATIFRGHNT